MTIAAAKTTGSPTPSSPGSSPADLAAIEYRQIRSAHWDRIADSPRPRHPGAYYHRRLEYLYGFIIPPGRRILEIGCGRGDLLAALRPSVGVGVDFSSRAVAHAQNAHPQLRFIQQDAHDLELDESFDVIVLSDIINDLWDVQTVLKRIAPFCAHRARLVMNFYSRLWGIPLAIAQRLQLATPVLRQNWLTVPDVDNLLRLAGFESLRSWTDSLWPIGTPLIASFVNRLLSRAWPLSQMGLTNFLIARPSSAPTDSSPRVSVIVPARNEAGNIDGIFARVPEMGAGTDLVFVEGHSTDDTAQTIRRAMENHPHRACKLLQQSGVGKADAVREGMAQADGDVLMILDADLTVPPEDLARFYEALRDGKGDFLNGVRLVYPMEDRAMRPVNFLGNKFFSLAFSWLLGQSVKDTLCGTKVLWRDDYRQMVENRGYFGDFDPFGDFELLLGAAKMGLKITDLPVRYRQRIYGSTNIHRWKHGWMLLRMCAFAAWKIKFI